MPSTLMCIELSLDVGDTLSLADFEPFEIGVAACEVLKGAIVAYVRELPACSTDEGASGAVMGGAATAVVILFGKCVCIGRVCRRKG